MVAFDWISVVFVQPNNADWPKRVLITNDNGIAAAKMIQLARLCQSRGNLRRRAARRSQQHYPFRHDETQV
jgi:hypothetical protein